MVRNLIIAAVSLVAFTAPAAAAEFSGPRVGANVGFIDDDIFGTETFTYGANAGFDWDLGTTVVGLTGEYQDSEDTGRDLSASVRFGVKAGSNALVYGTAGYTNLGVGSGTGVHLDGVRVGAGLEFAVGKNAYLNVEQRYANYELGVDGFQTVVGAGFRF